MDEAQELEWLEAQNIVISRDLVAIAKEQLLFLEAVDRNRCLYDGPVLDRAIHRYKNYWLPLLDKHNQSKLTSGPLVVPLDCEWVWHCHRLNPVRYKSDCERFYGRILDNHDVLSNVKGASKQETAELWNNLYPKEPYELDFCYKSTEDNAEAVPAAIASITYDLVSAVKRQSTFGYQVTRPCMHDVRFLQEAVARYKGFLHLIKRNKERSIQQFCVPTYDIDLIWHSHQLQPACYNKDLIQVLGRVLEHDDTDSDRSKGKKLDVGFSSTTKQWEETFGRRYWRAGAMHRGNSPSPVVVNPISYADEKVLVSCKHEKVFDLPMIETIQVYFQFVRIKNFTAEPKGSLFVNCSKKQPDIFFSSHKRIGIESEVGKKHTVSFQCEPKGELVFELVSCTSSNLPLSRQLKTIGTTSLSLEGLVNSPALSAERWFELESDLLSGPEPIYLHIAVSVTVPTFAPFAFHVSPSRQYALNSCLHPLLGRLQQLKRWTRFVDAKGSEVISMQMRNFKKTEVDNSCSLKRGIVGVSGCSGQEKVLAKELIEHGGLTKWLFSDYDWCLQLEKKKGVDGYLIDFQGHGLVKFFLGRKLDFELEYHKKQKNEQDFITIVEFSSEYPYGKALALFNLKSGFLKINQDWFVFPGLVLAFILSDTLRKDGKLKFITNGITNGCTLESLASEGAIISDLGKKYDGTYGQENVVKSGACSGGCSGSCGSACNTAVTITTCGANCSGECGAAQKNGQEFQGYVIIGNGGGKCSGKCGGGGCGGGKCGGGCRNSDMLENIGHGGCGGGGCSGACGECAAGGLH
ncbi:Glycine-rich domain-containing protein 2 [Nymphaea thermarum]|nr:Glycine-rich domain-containing protein 2 [Nymphaea thermarum]